jgi:hypothetical protein
MYACDLVCRTENAGKLPSSQFLPCQQNGICSSHVRVQLQTVHMAASVKAALWIFAACAFARGLHILAFYTYRAAHVFSTHEPPAALRAR